MVEGQIAIRNTGRNTEHTWNLKKIFSAHKILTKYSHKRTGNERICESTLMNQHKQIAEKPVTDEMATFTGGRGFGLKLMWDSLNRRPVDSPGNALPITTGRLQYGPVQDQKSLCLSISPQLAVTVTVVVLDHHSSGLMPLDSRWGAAWWSRYR
jgi:hypothetical protein